MIVNLIRNWLAALRRESQIPSPPFTACKRVGHIMYGLWYGRITPEQARAKARQWGFSEADTARMVSEATQPPSYWSRKENQA